MFSHYSSLGSTEGFNGANETLKKNKHLNQETRPTDIISQNRYEKNSFSNLSLDIYKTRVLPMKTKN